MLVLAFSFQGTRGLWEPDEGFYGSVALGMANGASWWVPHLNGQPFLDKPPLQYWGMLAGTWLLGPNEWGLRLANAAWLALTALVTGALAGRLWGRRHGPPAAVAYGITLAPFCAANALTPDTALTFFTTAVVYAYWRAWAEPVRSRAIAWELMAGALAGGGALAKGPATFLVVAPLLLHALWTTDWRRTVRSGCLIGATALVVGGAWYVPVGLEIPGALVYMFDNQVWGRLVSPHYERNASLLGPLKAYLPMLLPGTLPWLLWIVAGLAPGRAKGRVLPGIGPRGRLLLLWSVVPLGLLVVARSRLPLYALPVLPALVLAAYRWLALRGSWGVRLPGRGAPAALWFWVWFVLLVGLKLGLAQGSSERDARALAARLQDAGVSHADVVVAVDRRVHALLAYGYERLVWTRAWNRPYPFFRPPISLEEFLSLPETSALPRVVLVAHATRRDALIRRLPPHLRSCATPAGHEFVIVDCATARQVAPAGTAGLVFASRSRVGEGGRSAR